MAERQTLNQEQTLALRLTPQQLRYARLLEMNASELDEAVERELEANPALEQREPAVQRETAAPLWGGLSGRRTDDDQGAPVLADMEPSLIDVLDEQIDGLSLEPAVEDAARYIAASLDSNGYLRRDVPGLTDDMVLSHGMDVDEDVVRRALEVVRSLEPHGVGAYDLRDALMLQLRARPAGETRDDALRIIGEEFVDFSTRHYQTVMKRLGLTQERLGRATSLITSLNPKPGAAAGSGEVSAAIIPDVVLERNQDGGLDITLNNRYPELAVQESFVAAMAEMEQRRSERTERRERGRGQGHEFIVSNYNDARDFIRILAHRQQTLRDVMTAILSIQREYFATEDVYALRPMMLKDISALTGLDFSVISRATAGKYVQTPWGIFPFRFFFSDSKGESGSVRSRVPEGVGEGRVGGEDAGNDGDAEGDETLHITNRKIEALITQVVGDEDKRHPLSDERIRGAMAAAGFDISRRTVAKYRDRLGIPVARLRREMGSSG